MLDQLTPVQREIQGQDGTWFLARVLPCRPTSEQIQGVVITLVDITEHKRAELALRESEARFRALVMAGISSFYQMSPDWREMWTLDSHGFILNNVVPNRDWLDQYILPDDQPMVLAAIDEAVKNKQMFELEHRVRRADGSVGWAHSRAVPLLDEEGAITSWFGAASDVTDRREMEEALRVEHQHKDEFLATLGHELRNPLAPLRTVTDLFKQRLPPDPKLQQLVQIQERQLDCLTRLVDDLLDVARIQSGHIHLQRVPLDLREPVAAAVDTARATTEPADQVLTLEQADAALPVLGDPIRLLQAVTNLLNNAAKYSPKGSPIRVQTRLIDGQVEVRVRDSGIGLAPELTERIFDLFIQGPQYGGDSPSGLGLGLTLVRRILALHDGTAEAHSEGPGQGSEFILRLPRSVEAAAALAEASAAGGDGARDDAGAKSASAPQSDAESHSDSERGPGAAAAEQVPAVGGAAVEAARGTDAGAPAADGDGSSGTRRILVVDDNPDIATSLVLALEAAGHAVQAAYSGAEALTAAAAFKPDAVVLDIGLPDMDGHALARALRQQPETAEAVLIAVTGYGQASDREQAYAAGIDHHLPK
ncbi:MAG: ATP-binding protein, partial [Halochromatium sp.]|uniref:PAS domain-containing hybrid sensor histidine kinase/response regulator n=1 Tax=Halochromatium sp. TaxID=2049430 RepID=UPI00397A65CF